MIWNSCRIFMFSQKNKSAQWRFIYFCRIKYQRQFRYGDVIISTMASQITRVSIIYSNVCSNADQRKHQSSASLAFVRGIHRGPVNSPHKGPVTRKMFPFDDVIMLGLMCICDFFPVKRSNHEDLSHLYSYRRSCFKLGAGRTVSYFARYFFQAAILQQSFME